MRSSADAWIGRSGQAGETEALRDAYAFAADTWVADGAPNHYVVAPFLADLLEPWYGLGFAQMHVDAIRVTVVGEHRQPSTGLSIRRGGPADLEGVALPIDNLIAEHQKRTPSFSSASQSEATSRADWIGTLEAPDTIYFVAERAGEIVGHTLLYDPTPGLGVPDDAAYLASTATVAAVRGSGVGTALVARALATAQAEGRGTVLTNWRATNLEAARFWSARGFRPTFCRLHRAIASG